MMKLKNQNEKRNEMSFKIGAILGILSLLGMVYGYKLGGAIYLLLAGAVLMVLYGMIQWRRPA
jgi:hypothetical protein